MKRAAVLVGLAILLVGGFSPLKAQMIAPDAPPFLAHGLRPQFVGDLEAFPDVPQYTFNLTLIADFDQAVLVGRGSLRYTNITPDILTEIVLRLYPNLETFGGDAVIENATISGEPIAPSLDETRSVVGLILPQVLPPGESVTIDFDYSVTVFHDRKRLYNQFSYLETELALASALPLLSVYDEGAGWWRGTQHAQGDAVYSEVGNFDVTLTAPDYLKVITSGTTVEEAPAADGSITYHYAAPLMRDFAIMASRNYQTVAGSVGDIALEVHYLTPDPEAAQKVLQWAADALMAYTQQYGEYVYPELDVVETYTSAGGIEYPGLIVASNEVWGLSGNSRERLIFEWVIAHEVAHQWWYSMVGNNQVIFPWLDEALTDYSVAIYWEAIEGQAGYQELIGIFQRLYTDYESEAGSGLVGQPATAYSVEAYSPLVYRKGAFFFHNLRQLLGDEVFFGALRTYLSAYRYKIATPFDLQTILEQTSGIQLDDWFNRWIGYSN